jgi:ribA/ribD-fused uncharacterized protein
MISDFGGDWAFLSNFYRAPFYFRGVQFPTAEHAFQAAKMLRDEDRRRVTTAATPREAKRLGRMLTRRPAWDRDRKLVMLEVCLAKFTQHADLAARLLATGDALLVEGNSWHDQDWGACYCGEPRCAEPGKNYLGQILMSIRFVLRED